MEEKYFRAKARKSTSSDVATEKRLWDQKWDQNAFHLRLSRIMIPVNTAQTTENCIQKSFGLIKVFLKCRNFSHFEIVVLIVSTEFLHFVGLNLNPWLQDMFIIIYKLQHTQVTWHLLIIDVVKVRNAPVLNYSTLFHNLHPHNISSSQCTSVVPYT